MLLGYDLSTLGDALYGNLRPLCNQITLGSYSFMNNTIMSQVKFYWAQSSCLKMKLIFNEQL